MKIKNYAAVLKKQKKDLLVLNLDYPQVPKNYVLVKMKFSGICHTQLNEISGKLGKDRFLPHCMGHEGVGEIVSIGLGVNDIKIGDKVVISWIKKKQNKKISPTSYNCNSTPFLFFKRFNFFTLLSIQVIFSHFKKLRTNKHA